MRDAYLCLSKYKDIDFLLEFYDVEHTLSFKDVIDDLTAICQKTKRGRTLPLFINSFCNFIIFSLYNDFHNTILKNCRAFLLQVFSL